METVSEQFKGQSVLVTGASGFTGSILVKKLVGMGARVRAIARPSSNIDQFSGMPIEWFRGQVYDEQIIRESVREINFVFHVAAAYRQAGIANQEYRDVHVTSTQRLAQALKGSTHLKRFVHVSTVGVHGHITSPPADEETVFAPGDEYQRTKTEAEKWIRTFAKATSFPLVVIRPAAIYGPGDQRLFKVFKMATLPFFPILGRGKCLYHLIHVEDLTDALLAVALHPQACGEVFIVGASEPVELEKMAKIIAQECGKKLRPCRLPAWPFFTLAKCCETICRPLGLEPPIYERRVAFFTKDRAFDTSKIKKLIGFQPRYSNEQGLKETCRWYIENNWLKSNLDSLASKND